MPEAALAILATIGAASVCASIWARKRREQRHLSKRTRKASLEETAVRAANMGAWTWRPQVRELRVSDGWLELFGVSRDDFGGRLPDWLQRVHPTYQASLREAIQDVLDGRTGTLCCDARMQAANGSYFWAMVRGGLRESADGEKRLVGMLADITSVVDVERRVLDDAYRDRLTGLPNRHAFLSVLDAACHAAAENRDEQFALLFLDLNRFKAINDSMGHGVGDALLAAVAVRLENNRRPGDAVARMGGDEFVVLLRRTADEEQALRIARRLHQALTEPYRIGAHDLSAGASIGVTLNAGASLVASDILRDADQAMYRAKTRGGGVVVFNQEMRERAARTGQMQNELGEAARRGLFELYYQPVFALGDQKVYAVEALLRWNRSARERLAAGEFIGAAKESGLIAQLDRTAVQLACRQRAEWERLGLGTFRVAVNLAGGQLAHPRFPSEVESLLAEANLEPGLLELEAPEQALIESLQGDPGVLRALVDMGVSLCVDDFGMDDGSLSGLARLPAATLKLDGSFLAGARRSERSLRMLRGVLSFAKEMGMRIGAESVESSEEADWLLGLGFDLAQGYFFARPTSVERLTPMLLDGRFEPAVARESSRSLAVLQQKLAGRDEARYLAESG